MELYIWETKEGWWSVDVKLGEHWHEQGGVEGLMTDMDMHHVED